MDIYFTLFKQILEGRMGRAAELAKAAAAPSGKTKDRWRRRGSGGSARGRGRSRGGKAAGKSTGRPAVRLLPFFYGHGPKAS